MGDIFSVRNIDVMCTSDLSVLPCSLSHSLYPSISVPLPLVLYISGALYLSAVGSTHTRETYTKVYSHFPECELHNVWLVGYSTFAIAVMLCYNDFRCASLRRHERSTYLYLTLKIPKIVSPLRARQLKNRMKSNKLHKTFMCAHVRGTLLFGSHTEKQQQQHQQHQKKKNERKTPASK